LGGTYNPESTVYRFDDDNDPAVIEYVHVPGSGEVADMIKCLIWYERQREIAPTSALLLKKIRELAAS
jgi:hypothetical protein